MDVDVQRLKQKNENIPVLFQEIIALPLPWGVFLSAGHRFEISNSRD